LDTVSGTSGSTPGVVGTPSFSFTLAPQTVVAAMGGDTAAYCPLHSLLRGISNPATQANLVLNELRISGYDLPLPEDQLQSNCTFPDCTATGGCRKLGIGSVQLSTEPAMLQRDVLRSLRDVGLDGTGTTVSFLPPPLDLWNPALNRSDWAPTDLLCDIAPGTFRMPALPFTGEDPSHPPQITSAFFPHIGCEEDRAGR